MLHYLSFKLFSQFLVVITIELTTRKRAIPMPELPEVNTFQRYFNGTSLNQKIREVVVHDDKIIQDISGMEFAEKLKGTTFTSSYRQGKYLFGELDNGHSVLLHFGMTGDIKYYTDDLDQPKHERFAFYFENGSRLGFDCPRKFAKIRYLEDRTAYIKQIKLGTDALSISTEEFLEKAKGKKATIKGFLLNQKQLAGVGNLYADEVLYQLKIHPASRVNKLNKKQLTQIIQKIQAILQKAIDRTAYYKAYPEDWFWQWRKDGMIAPDGKSKIETDKIGGRTTYFFPDYQKIYV